MRAGRGGRAAPAGAVPAGGVPTSGARASGARASVVRAGAPLAGAVPAGGVPTSGARASVVRVGKVLAGAPLAGALLASGVRAGKVLARKVLARKVLAGAVSAGVVQKNTPPPGVAREDAAPAGEVVRRIFGEVDVAEIGGKPGAGRCTAPLLKGLGRKRPTPEGKYVLAGTVPRLWPAEPRRGVATGRARPVGDVEGVARPAARGEIGDRLGTGAATA